MSLEQRQRNLNHRFVYFGDRKERWNILKGAGPIAGDCEDYSLTLIWMNERQNMLRFWFALITLKYVIWFCKVNGTGHAAMWCRGHGWTDNIQKKFVTKAQMKKQGYKFYLPIIAPLVAMKLLIRAKR